MVEDHGSCDEYIVVRGEPGELKHLSSPRKRKKFDSASSGERKRKSLNRMRVIARGRCVCGVVGTAWRGHGPSAELQNITLGEAVWKTAP